MDEIIQYIISFVLPLSAVIIGSIISARVITKSTYSSLDKTVRKTVAETMEKENVRSAIANIDEFARTAHEFLKSNEFRALIESIQEAVKSLVDNSKEDEKEPKKELMKFPKKNE